MGSVLRAGVSLIVQTVKAWVHDGGPQLSAAIAYYAVLSLAPMVMLVAALAAAAFGDVSQTALHEQMALVLGHRGAEFAMSILQDAKVPDREFPGLVGHGVILLIGATILYANVQGALNRIWGLKWIKGGAVRGVVRQRLLAFAMIVVTGVLLLVSLIVSAVATLMRANLDDVFEVPAMVNVIDAGLSMVILTVLFGATFRILPDGDASWRDVAVGSFVTAALFVVGKTLLTFYLARATVVGAFGVAGSLVFFLIWVYYSAAIYFLGAEFTQQWARMRGRPIQPDKGAVRIGDAQPDAR